MQTFNTPHPVALTIRFAGGTLQVLAEGRDSTTVEISPANPSSAADVEHAAATTVEQRGNEIVIIAPDTKRWFGRTPKLDVKVAAPTDSGLTAFVESADVRLRGHLGSVDVNSASGNVRVEHAASLTVSTASGDVWGDAVGGDGRVKTASGDVRLTDVTGTGDVTTASGDIQIQQRQRRRQPAQRLGRRHRRRRRWLGHGEDRLRRHPGRLGHRRIGRDRLGVRRRLAGRRPRDGRMARGAVAVR